MYFSDARAGDYSLKRRSMKYSIRKYFYQMDMSCKSGANSRACFCIEVIDFKKFSLWKRFFSSLKFARRQIKLLYKCLT